MTPVTRLYLLVVVPLASVLAVAYAVGPVTLRAPVFSLYGSASSIALLAGLALLAAVRRWRPSIRPSIALAATVAGTCLAATGAWLLPLVLTLAGSAVLAPWTGPLADEALAAPEGWLGLRQVDARAAAMAWGVMPVLVVVYGSLRVQGRGALAYWLLVRRDDRPLWEVATAFALCAAACLALYLVMPAAGPWAHYGSVEPVPAWLSDWWPMRSGRAYTLVRVDGFIGAPSFHAAFAVLLTRAWWDSPARLGVCLVNCVMLVATWVVGWHYLTDIAMGATLAITSLLLTRHVTRGAR